MWLNSILLPGNIVGFSVAHQYDLAGMIIAQIFVLIFLTFAFILVAYLFRAFKRILSRGTNE